MSHPRPSLFERHALGELDADERLALESHASGCPRCAGRLAAERALDDAIVRTSGEALPAGTSRRMFDDLWARVDEADVAAPPEPTRGLRRAAAIVALLAAAAIVMRLALGSGGEADVAPLSAPEPASAPIVEPAPIAEPTATPSVGAPAAPAETSSWDSYLAAALERPGATTLADDEVTRRAAAADELAALLVTADAAASDDAAFVATCTEAIDALRADGLAVDPLVRRIVAGGDVDAGRAAVRVARLGLASDGVLARALDDERHAAVVVDALRSHGIARPATARLERALVARLDDGAPQHAAAALRAVGADAALAEELARRVVVAERRPSSRATRDVLELGRVAPPRAAVAAWLDLAALGQLDVAWREFEVTVERDRAAALDALVDALDHPRREDVATDWARALGDAAAAPALVTRAVALEDDAALTDALAIADARAVPALFDAWRAGRTRPWGDRLALSAARLLDADAARDLVADLPPDALDDVVAFATELDAARAVSADLLVALVEHVPPRDEARRALVLGHLARLGEPRHADALLAVLSRREADALGWLTAAALAPEVAERAFVAAGGSPDTLSALLDEAAPWPTSGHLPSNRVVRRVARALERMPSPATSPVGED